jgi:hypothetical protein
MDTIGEGAFENIKTAIANAPSLRSPDFSKYFLLYTFASEHSLAAILTQKDEQGDEYPVSFMSTGLQGVELNYPLVDKQAFSSIKKSSSSDRIS